MPERFVVPQFIEVEDKIFGPITVRQFIVILVDFGLIFICYKIFDFALFIITGLPLLAFGFVMAFIKINGQAFHYFLLNITQTLRRPHLKVWDKSLLDEEVKSYLHTIIAPPPPPPPSKAPLEASRLADLSLVVNTGGVYEPEQW